MTITQEITSFPTPLPNRDVDTESEFSDNVDSFISHINTHVTEENTWATQANDMADTMNIEIGSMYVGTSSTSVAIGIGSKTFTVNESSKAFAANASIRIVDAADPNTKYMIGTVTSYNTGTKSLVVDVTSVGGSGTLSNWLINVGGDCGRIQNVPVDTASPSDKDTLVYNSTSGEYEPSTHVGTLVEDVERNENNIIIEAFRRMLGDSQAGADPFQDGWVDVFEDDSNIDAGNSSNYDVPTSVGYVVPTYLALEGSEVEFEAGATKFISCCEIDTDKFFVAYQDDDDSDKGKGVVATVSGHVITFGSPVEFDATVCTYISCCYISTDKVAIAYYDSTNTQCECVIGTISVTVPSFGTPVVVDTNVCAYTSICLIDTAKILISYVDSTSTIGECRVATISGTVPTFGNVETFNNAETAYVSSCAVDTDKAFIAFRDTGDANKGKGVVITVSVKVITVGSEVEFEASATGWTTCSKLSTTQVLVAFRESGGDGEIIVGTIAGASTLSFGAVVIFETNDTDHIHLARIEDSRAFLSYHDDTDNQGECRTVSVTGTVPAVSEATLFNSTDDVTYNAVAYIATDKAVIAFTDAGDTNKGKGIIANLQPQNMTLVFDAKETEDEPDESKVLFIMEDIDSSTLNTDIKAWASLDDGSNYEQITLEDVGDFESAQHIIVGTEALTDRNDQTTRLKITTENNKEIRIHAISNMLHLQ